MLGPRALPGGRLDAQTWVTYSLTGPKRVRWRVGYGATLTLPVTDAVCPVSSATVRVTTHVPATA